MSEIYRYIHCNIVGIAGTTPVVIVQHVKDLVYEARVGIALLGQDNGGPERTKNPFDEQFRDNYAIGKGITEEEALEAMKKNMKNLAAPLWN